MSGGKSGTTGDCVQCIHYFVDLVIFLMDCIA